MIIIKKSKKMIYIIEKIKFTSQISSLDASEISSDMSEVLKNDLIYEALNLKETNEYLLNSSTSFSELNTNDTDLIASDIKSLDDIKLEIVHKILEKKCNKKKIDKIEKEENEILENNSQSKINISQYNKKEKVNNENDVNDISEVISFEKMNLLSKINKISINLYSLNLKYPSNEQFVKYLIKYSIPDNIPVLTNTHMYTQFITDTQMNNTMEIKLNHENNIKLSFNTQLLKYWLKMDTVISIEVEAIQSTNKKKYFESKNEKNYVLWKGISFIKCRDLINLPLLKIKSYIPLYKELSPKKKLGF
eukprot:jgi/Orpsp1_1/1177695/evm.model.c7180000062472.2